MTSEVRGIISGVLLALQISLVLRKSLVTLGIFNRFIVISSCSCVYVSSRTLSLKYHVTFGGGKPPITSHNRDISLPSLNGCSILARLLALVYITGFFGGTVSKLNSDHRNLFDIGMYYMSVISNYTIQQICHHFLIRSISFVLNIPM